MTSEYDDYHLDHNDDYCHDIIFTIMIMIIMIATLMIYLKVHPTLHW